MGGFGGAHERRWKHVRSVVSQIDTTTLGSRRVLGYLTPLQIATAA